MKKIELNNPIENQSQKFKKIFRLKGVFEIPLMQIFKKIKRWLAKFLKSKKVKL